MKIVLVLVGITFLVLAVLLTIIGLIAWIASRPKKQAAAPYPQQGYPPPGYPYAYPPGYGQRPPGRPGSATATSFATLIRPVKFDAPPPIGNQ